MSLPSRGKSKFKKIYGTKLHLGFFGGASGKESTCQSRRCKRPGFDPWVGKIPWRKAWQPSLVFLPGELHGQKGLYLDGNIKCLCQHICSYIYKIICVYVCQLLSHVILLMILWTIIHQAPLSMGFSRQEYWRRLLFSPPGDVPDSGIKSTSTVSPALQADSLPLSHCGSPEV